VKIIINRKTKFLSILTAYAKRYVAKKKHVNLGGNYHNEKTNQDFWGYKYNLCSITFS